MLSGSHYATGVPASLLQAGYGWVTERGRDTENLVSGVSTVWALVALIVHVGQPDGKRGAHVHLAFDRHLSPMQDYDLFRDS